ncbi:uncharacterized protein LOC105182510 isoform X2 [Harpegnathos saltator]|uniref:Uncharacterized protein n=1 Tax=Harpegnathos saltator TaxID=610380 RepID=E2B3L6_HARSA|nr:uncharacterized protein LOC105182510 isoform X2 [Harpegnathos saltator]EFN89702.1 hypothetical protein EAI_01017 [Harpegnathos saltator]
MIVRIHFCPIQQEHGRESMSPSIPILFALLLPLISRSAEGEWGTAGVALLRRTLRYWRKIYNTYDEEVILGYCWADYLAQISVELWMNSAASLSPARERCNTSDWATNSQRNPFPGNVMADAPRRRETLRGHSREKRSLNSTISGFVKDPNGHRIAAGWRVTGERERRRRNAAAEGATAMATAMADKARQGADNVDRGERMIAAMTDCRGRLPIARSGLPREPPPRCCASPANSGAVNPAGDKEVEAGAPREHHVVEYTRRRRVPLPADRGLFAEEEEVEEEKDDAAGRRMSAVERVRRFTGVQNSSASSRSARGHAEPSALRKVDLEVVEQRFLGRALVRNLRALVVAILRTIGTLMQVGQEFMDIADSNSALSCTRTYLWRKLEKWLDT